MQEPESQIIHKKAAEIMQEAFDSLPLPETFGDERDGKLAGIQIKFRIIIQRVMAGHTEHWSKICSIIDEFNAVKAEYFPKEEAQKKVDEVIDGAKAQIKGIKRRIRPPAVTGESDALVTQFLDIDDKRMIYASEKMKRVMELVERIAGEETAVLILGETGVGKEFIAKALHYLSPRHKEPFIAINCSAIPSELLESELFGHKKGSFTGAMSDKQGYFATVRSGTLFLDEIGDLPLDMQAKILRILQDGRFRKVGSANGEEKFYGRIVTATNNDLSAKIEHGKFRPDLFYRISQFPLNVPPLRERPEDIDPLVDFFLKKQKKQFYLSTIARRKIHKHPFNGNIRELEHVITRACILATMNRAELDPITIKEEHIVFTSPVHPANMTETHNNIAARVADLERRLEVILEHFEMGQSGTGSTS